MKLVMDESQGLWAQEGQGRISKISGSLEDMAESILGQTDTVYVAGLKRHAALLCQLHLTKKKLGGARVCVGTPMRLLEISPRAVNTMLAAMDSCNDKAASLGGWHEFTDQDAASYELLLPNDDADYAYLLRRHPAWPAVSFLPRTDIRAAAAVLSEILDPRWFIEPADVERAATLKAYFGVFPRVARYYLNGTGQQHRNYLRFANLVQFWSKKQFEPDPECLHDFVRRCYARREDPITGVQRASALCLNLIRGVWLQALTPGQEVFVPKYFFEGEDECYRESLCTSFEKHWRRHQEKRAVAKATT